MTDLSTVWARSPMTKPDFYEGQSILLCLSESDTGRRIRGRIVGVHCFGATVLYDTDIPWPQDSNGKPTRGTPRPFVGVSTHWLLPVDAITCLSELFDD